jgi:2-hydroxy-6-oxonona-2,4-dienedioate hydrolase
MPYELIPYQNTHYIDKGAGNPIVLLHGLMGALSNFREVIEHFSMTHRVIIPHLPLFSKPLLDTSVKSLVNFVDSFIKDLNLKNVILVGNSLGGHIALLYTIKMPVNVKALVLTASSGLFENTMGNTYPRRDYEFIKQKTEETFYDATSATKELIDEVFSVVNEREKLVRLLILAKSAIRHNLKDDLHQIKCPTLLLWGKQDTITPPFVAEDFHKLIERSEIGWIDRAGHAPMMEQPADFNNQMQLFLDKLS